MLRNNFIIKPIGYVKNTKDKETLRYSNKSIEFDMKTAASQKSDLIISEIIINEEHAETLDGIEEFSHLIIIFWAHKTPEKARQIKKVHPGGLKKMPLKGIFSTRSPIRPNPICITTVRLLERKDNILIVDRMDAINNTPVLDIKPHLRYYDVPHNVKIASWVNELMNEYAKLYDRLKRNFNFK
ncbi:MAG: tRNA (N6-threonylcarbamoyladenosine(37)-N6)-methyltransferase TrmO [Promethearchaeota archaeon]